MGVCAWEDDPPFPLISPGPSDDFFLSSVPYLEREREMNTAETVLHQIVELEHNRETCRAQQIRLVHEAIQTRLWEQHPDPVACQSVRAWLRYGKIKEPAISTILFAAEVLWPFCEKHGIAFDPMTDRQAVHDAAKVLRRYIKQGDPQAVADTLAFCRIAERGEIRRRYQSRRTVLADHYAVNGFYVIIPKRGVHPSKICERLATFSELGTINADEIKALGYAIAAETKK